MEISYMGSGSTSTSFEEYFRLEVRHSKLASYLCTVAFVILLYDSIITIADEVRETILSTFETHC